MAMLQELVDDEGRTSVEVAALKRRAWDCLQSARSSACPVHLRLLSLASPPIAGCGSLPPSVVGQEARD